jgi:hypothetical protein
VFVCVKVWQSESEGKKIWAWLSTHDIYAYKIKKS